MASSSVYQRIRVADRPALITREAAGRGLFGGAVGIALWCSLFALQLLPGSLGDTPGVVTMGVAGVLAGIGRLRRWLHGALQLMAWTVTIVALSPLSETIAARIPVGPSATRHQPILADATQRTSLPRPASS